MGMLDLKPRQEKVIQVEQQQDVSFLGSVQLHKGHKFWQLVNGKVTACELIEHGSTYDQDTKLNTKRYAIHREPGVNYTEALNCKNAVKRFLKAGFFVDPKHHEKELIKLNYLPF